MLAINIYRKMRAIYVFMDGFSGIMYKIFEQHVHVTLSLCLRGIQKISGAKHDIAQGERDE